jgi:hypothetical protein
MSSIKSKLDRLEQKFNPQTNSPICIAWFGDEPDFRGKPQTKAEAIEFIKRREKRSSNGPKDLVLMPVDTSTPTLRSYLMDKFNISEDEI